MALSADSQREKRGLGRMVVYPVKDDAIIFKGAIVTINAAGLAIAGIDTASTTVGGIAVEKVDATDAGDGVKKIRCWVDAEFLFVATSITQAMINTLMMVVDDNTVDDAAGATNDIPVGKLTEFVSTTKGWVYVPGPTSL